MIKKYCDLNYVHKKVACAPAHLLKEGKCASNGGWETGVRPELALGGNSAHWGEQGESEEEAQGSEYKGHRSSSMEAKGSTTPAG